MATKQMKFDSAAHLELKRGVDQLVAAVAITMGPVGHNVLLQKSYGSPVITKDGVTVAKEVDLPAPFENIGAKMVQQVAKKTADVAQAPNDPAARRWGSASSRSLRCHPAPCRDDGEKPRER